MSIHMRHLNSQTEDATLCSHTGPAAGLLSASPMIRPPSLSAETVAVTLGTIVALTFLSLPGAQSARWLAIPALLVAAALLPTWVRKREFPCLGLDPAHLRSAVPVVCRVCIATFPPVFLGLWLLTLAHVPIPLRPPLDEGWNWLGWLHYQFLYVALAEEVFFRGYVQTNTARLLSQTAWLSGPWQQRVAMLVSAACFALAHFVVQSQITSLLVFLPGLVLAWLFVHTRSLLAPILFHGLANVSYGVMASALT